MRTGKTARTDGQQAGTQQKSPANVIISYAMSKQQVESKRGANKSTKPDKCNLQNPKR